MFWNLIFEFMWKYPWRYFAHPQRDKYVIIFDSCTKKLFRSLTPKRWRIRDKSSHLNRNRYSKIINFYIILMTAVKLTSSLMSQSRDTVWQKSRTNLFVYNLRCLKCFDNCQISFHDITVLQHAKHDADSINFYNTAFLSFKLFCKWTYVNH